MPTTISEAAWNRARARAAEQVGPCPEIAPGTPYRRVRQAAAQSEWAARIHIAIDREALQVEIAEAKRDWRRRRRANMILLGLAPSADESSTRRRVFAGLRRLGFRRDSTSGRSAYYRLGPLLVRVSDHEVPLTVDRERSLMNGGRSWADSRLSLVIGGDVDPDEWLAEISRLVEQIV